MGMFDNYNNTTSNNLVKKLFLNKYYSDYIMPGSTCIHYFKLPFNFNNISNIKIVYRQLDRLTLEKTNVNLIFNDSNNCLLSCELKEDETLKFGGTLLDTEVQIKLNIDNSTIQSKVFKIKVLDKLEELKNGK